MAKLPAYYAGALRVLIDGVPCRVARKPSPWMVAELKQVLKDGEPELALRALQAKKRIEDYAAALDISVAEAKGRIECQRLRNLYHPVIDLSLEYDL